MTKPMPPSTWIDWWAHLDIYIYIERERERDREREIEREIERAR